MTSDTDVLARESQVAQGKTTKHYDSAQSIKIFMNKEECSSSNQQEMNFYGDSTKDIDRMLQKHVLSQKSHLNKALSLQCSSRDMMVKAHTECFIRDLREH